MHSSILSLTARTLRTSLLWLCLGGPGLLLSAHGVDIDPASGSVSPSVPELANSYRLAWSDEFRGNQLDQDKWVYRTDTKHWSTQLPANVTVQDGLHIALRKENPDNANGKKYSAGGVISRKEFVYGYYEARFRVPPGSGWHTSFWTMKYKGADTSPTGTQEIDICEQDSVKTTTYSGGVIAWDQHGRGYGRKYVKTPSLSDDFHVWGCEYTPTHTDFYFDNKLVTTADSTHFRAGPQSIWLTVISTWLGSTWGVDEKSLPSEAVFSYVRFFEKIPGTPDTVPPAAAPAPAPVVSAPAPAAAAVPAAPAAAVPATEAH